uniref:Uncharacterized protein n=1 Tax=Coccolithus braarudii TaxID=221442 RepID=A0A7S0LF48_9EUKA
MIEVARKDCGATPLFIACQNGHTECVSTLLNARASVINAMADGASPLFIACQEGHADVASLLIEGGARTCQARNTGATPLLIAVHRGHLGCVQLLCSHSASRTLIVHGSVSTAEKMAAAAGHTAITDWLVTSKDWSTPLHHLAVIETDRARSLLRGGASLHAAACTGGPTPLSLAKEMMAAAKHAKESSAAALVATAAQPWSPATHALYPADARALAVELVLLGHRLSRLPAFEDVAQGLFDLWVDGVVPRLVMRDAHCGRGLVERASESTARRANAATKGLP